MTDEYSDKMIYEFIEGLRHFMIKGINMLDDEGQRAGFVYRGEDPKTRIEAKHNRMWCMVDTDNYPWKKLYRVDWMINIKAPRNYPSDDANWVFIGFFNEYTDILGLVEPDSNRRNDNGDRRNRYLSFKRAKIEAVKYMNTGLPTREELLEAIRKEAETIINHCLDTQSNLKKLFPHINADFRKPEI